MLGRESAWFLSAFRLSTASHALDEAVGSAPHSGNDSAFAIEVLGATALDVDSSCRGNGRASAVCYTASSLEPKERAGVSRRERWAVRIRRMP